MVTAASVPAFFTATAFSLRAALSLLAFTVLLVSYRRAGWIRGPWSLDSVVWDAEGRWFLSHAGKTWEAALRGDSWVKGHVMLLRWHAVEGGERRACMLFTASDLGGVIFRRLSVRLRIAGMRATSATDSLLA
jgi:hypothetical protein